MNPTAARPGSSVRTEADRSVNLTLTTDPNRPPVSFDATIRHPQRFRAACAAFLKAVGAGAGSVNPIATVAGDTWIVEGMAADQTAYSRISFAADEFANLRDVRNGTASVAIPATLPDSLNQLRGNVPALIRLEPSSAALDGRSDRPPGWLRGFSGLMAAMSLPTRRVAIDRGGLFGLISALGRSRTVRASRSVEVRWEPGRPAEIVVRPGGRPVPLQARGGEAGAAANVRVRVGHGLASLAGLVPWVDSAALFLLGPGLPSFWSVRLGGIHLGLGFPGWTADDRLGSLSLDPIAPPTSPGRFLAGQVAATLRDQPAQPLSQIVERTRSHPAEITAVLAQLAGQGQVMPDPETGLFRWRPAFADPAAPLDDLEPAEVAAARAIFATASIQIIRDEARPDSRGRRVEGSILDRPVTVDLDADGWMTRGHCTCSHHRDGGLSRRGPCRHQIALQAQAGPRAFAQPGDLAAWFAGFPGSLKPF